MKNLKKGDCHFSSIHDLAVWLLARNNRVSAYACVTIFGAARLQRNRLGLDGTGSPPGG